MDLTTFCGGTLLALAVAWPITAAAQACEQAPRVPRHVIAEAMRAHGPYSLTSTTTAMVFAIRGAPRHRAAAPAGSAGSHAVPHRSRGLVQGPPGDGGRGLCQDVGIRTDRLREPAGHPGGLWSAGRAGGQGRRRPAHGAGRHTLLLRHGRPERVRLQGHLGGPESWRCTTAASSASACSSTTA